MPPNPPRRRTTRPVQMPIILPRAAARLDRFKIEIVDQNGTITNVTSEYNNLSITEVDVRHGGGHVAVLTLSHTNRQFLNADGSFLWTGGEELKIFQDFQVNVVDFTDSNLIFRGKINHPKNYMSLGGQHTMVINGRKLPELKDARRNVTFVTGTTFFDAADTILQTYTNLIDLTVFTANLSGETGSFALSIEDTDMNILAFIFDQAGWSGFFDNDEDDDGLFVFNAFVDDGNERNE